MVVVVVIIVVRVVLAVVALILAVVVVVVERTAGRALKKQWSLKGEVETWEGAGRPFVPCHTPSHPPYFSLHSPVSPSSSLSSLSLTGQHF